MRRDLLSGILLIAGAVAGIMVMIFHPAGRILVTPANFPGQAALNISVHSVALAAVAILFLGLVGLSRRLGPSDLVTAALVAYGFGVVAVMSAAVASGFVATSVIEQLLTAKAQSRDLYQALFTYTGFINQGFAKVNVVASSVAVLLWSAAMWTTGRLPRAAAIAGAAVGTGVLLALLSGYLRLDVHGFGIVTFSQSIWLIWLGVLLCRERGAGHPQGVS